MSTSQIAAMRQELAQNRRLQAGLALAGLLVLGWAWLALGDWRTGLADRLQATEARILRMNDLADQDAWLERATQAAELRASLEAELPPVDSPGLAQAAFQSWLTRQLSSLGAQPQLSMEAPQRLERPAGLVRVSATLSGSMPTQQVIELLRRIESERQLIVVPSVLIRSEANQTFSLTVHAFYRLGADAGVSP